MIALVTGASSGIGRDIARELSFYGYDLVVVARDKDKLKGIYKDFGVRVTIIEADLRKKEECIKVYDKVKDMNIDILVNNAGFGDTGNFTETSLDKELDMIDLNIKGYHIMTKLFLRDFVKRDYGRILNIGSMAGLMPGPYMACYYATKSYVVNMSISIYEELNKDKSNVKISVFCPGPVETNFDNVAHSIFKVSYISSQEASKCAINGMFKDKLIIVPGNMKLNSKLVKLLPTKLVLWASSHVQKRSI